MLGGRGAELDFPGLTDGCSPQSLQPPMVSPAPPAGVPAAARDDVGEVLDRRRGRDNYASQKWSDGKGPELPRHRRTLTTFSADQVVHTGGHKTRPGFLGILVFCGFWRILVIGGEIPTLSATDFQQRRSPSKTADQAERLAAELTLVRPELMSHNSAIRVRDHSNAEIYRTRHLGPGTPLYSR